jgi:hypothetical protein
MLSYILGVTSVKLQATWRWSGVGRGGRDELPG